MRDSVPPRDTAPPPPKGVAVLTVREEFWSWALPMVDEAITCPFGFTARREEVSPVKAKLVVVALVVVELPVIVKLPMTVEEAPEM